MINIDGSSFVLPTKLFRRLTILLAIHNSEQISQHKIAKETKLSSSMVNSYIKQLSLNGLLTVSSRNNRDRNYQLTETGKNELASLLMAYSAEIVQLHAQTKNEISRRISGLTRHAGTDISIILFGASETCELVIRAMEEFPKINIIGIVDSDSKKHGTIFHSFKIQHPEKIRKKKPDCILITSFARQDEIYQSVKHFEHDGILIQKLTTI